MINSFKTWINEAGMLDTMSNFFRGYKPVTDAEVISTAKNFLGYLNGKGIKWDNSDKEATKNIKTLIKGLMLGSDDFSKNKNVSIGDVGDSLADLANSLSQVNAKIVTPEDIVRYYLLGNQSNPQKLPLQPNTSNPAIFDWPSIEKRFKENKPEEPVITKMNPYMWDPKQFDKLKPAVDQLKRRANFTTKNVNEDYLIANLLKSLTNSTGPWESMLKRVYYIYKTNVSGVPETCEEFVEHLTHWYHFPNYQAIHAQAEKIDKEIAKTVPVPSPSPPGPPPGSSKDKDLETLFNVLKINRKILTRNDPATFPVIPGRDYVNLADWKAAKEDMRDNIKAYVGKTRTHALSELLKLTR